jgi:hypothetical protein
MGRFVGLLLGEIRGNEPSDRHGNLVRVALRERDNVGVWGGCDWLVKECVDDNECSQ